MKKFYMAFTLLYAALAATFANAQNSATFELDVGPVSTLTWATQPVANGCTGSGSWSGSKGPSGSESVGRITDTLDVTLVCSWDDQSIVTLSWMEPTTNTDGSPLEDLAGTRLAWAEGVGSTSLFDCMDPEDTPGIGTVDRAPGENTHTVTNLTPGEWEFVAFAFNALGVCSGASNNDYAEPAAGTTVTERIVVRVPGVPEGVAVAP